MQDPRDSETSEGLPDASRISPSQAPDDGALAGLLRRRRSTRSYSSGPVDRDDLGRLLRTAIVGPAGRRPYASAHARYDVTTTVVAVDVEGLAPAAYQHRPESHELIPVAEGDHGARLAHATLDAEWLEECPAVLLLSADLAAADEAFATQGPGQGERFCWFEAGLIAQNVHLWAAENALGTVFLGGLDPSETRGVEHRLLPSGHTLLGVLPLGRPSRIEPTDL
ncbi:nitroreductase family protein [Nesterenkonia sp. F]|uniref:nitroreductase family protein n=1 Tax=Nesterenkonia sp. F TaxID=795955 RepID=UPI000255D00A|nr:nitroreductase family protein [Nesterenkonia sp. F]